MCIPRRGSQEKESLSMSLLDNNDPVTKWFEIAEICSNAAYEVAIVPEQTWLTQCLRNLLRLSWIENASSVFNRDTIYNNSMNAMIHTTLRATPAQLVSNRNAIHNVRFEANWKYTKERRQRLIQQTTIRETRRVSLINTMSTIL